MSRYLMCLLGVLRNLLFQEVTPDVAHSMCSAIGPYEPFRIKKGFFQALVV